METLETERLILRPFNISDQDDFFEYCSLDTVGPNAGWAVHKNKEFSSKIIQGFIDKDDVLAIVDKESHKVIGSVGLHNREKDLKEKSYELGYVLSTLYEGRGLMTEAVKRVMKYAFLEMKVPKIIVCHFIENNKSRRVVEKTGFTYDREGMYKTIDFGIKKSKYYSMTRNDYYNYMEGKI